MGTKFNKSKNKLGCFAIPLFIIGIFLAIIFSPLLWIPGIAATLFFAIRKSPTKKRNLLISAGITLLSLIIFAFFSTTPSPELTGIKAEWKADEYDIDDSVEVEISAIPTNADIESLTLSENSIASLNYKNGKAVVSFKSEGSEELHFIANKNIDSNSKLIKVIDKKAEAKRIAKEKKAKEKRIAEEKAEKEAKEKAEAERIAAEQAEAERIAAEQAEAERIAAEQAEAERIAAEQAEAERIAAEQAEAERIAAEQAAQQQAQADMVWIPQSGSKYHRRSDCSNMKNPSQVPLSQAQAAGYEPCKKCY